MLLYDNEIYVMDSFEFEYGRVLENVEVEFTTYGIPKYDEDGFITNAILFFSTFRGVYSFLRNSHEYILENSHFSDEFFCIVVTSLGTPESCSPSSTGLNYNFPKYTCLDAVNFQRQFLSEKFKIKKILGLVGEGIGGFQVLTWACEYPDEMEFIFLANTAARVSGYRFILGKTFENIVDSVDEFDSDMYTVSKNKAVIAINSLLFAHSASKKSFDKLDNDEINAIFDDFNDECFFRDIYDFKFRNDCDIEFDIVDKLSNIKAKSLFLSTNNNYFNYEFDMRPFKDWVKDSIVLIQEDKKENYFFENEDYEEIGKEVIDFLNQFKK